MAIDTSKPIEEVEVAEETGPILERPNHDEDEDLDFEDSDFTDDLGEDD